MLSLSGLKLFISGYEQIPPRRTNIYAMVSATEHHPLFPFLWQKIPSHSISATQPKRLLLFNDTNKLLYTRFLEKEMGKNKKTVFFCLDF